MAKPKEKVTVSVCPGNILQIWCDGAVTEDIKSVEGVVNILTYATMPLLSVFCDSRYDIQEIATEIEELLLTSVSDEVEIETQ